MSLSLQYDTGLFSKGSHNNKHKPTLSYNWKNAIFDLDYPFLYHMLIFAIAYIYDGVLYDCTRRFHRVFHPQTTREIRVTK